MPRAPLAAPHAAADGLTLCSPVMGPATGASPWGSGERWRPARFTRHGYMQRIQKLQPDITGPNPSGGWGAGHCRSSQWTVWTMRSADLSKGVVNLEASPGRPRERGHASAPLPRVTTCLLGLSLSLKMLPQQEGGAYVIADSIPRSSAQRPGSRELRSRPRWLFPAYTHPGPDVATPRHLPTASLRSAQSTHSSETWSCPQGPQLPDGLC